MQIYEQTETYTTLTNSLGVAATVFYGDCIEQMKQMVFAGYKFPLIFADPPFNIGQKYDEHNDSMFDCDFNVFTSTWLTRCRQLLAPNGIFIVNTPWPMLLRVLQSCNGMQQIDNIIWHYRFGQCQRSKFISSHTQLPVFRNGDGPHTFNADAILVESLRSSKYNDARITETENGGSRVPFDVWDDIPRVVGNAHERVPNHPNQLPEKLLTRIISAYSNVGDWCFDPFGGTGTTSKVSATLGRNSMTCELSSQYYVDIVNRLLQSEV